MTPFSVTPSRRKTLCSYVYLSKAKFPFEVAALFSESNAHVAAATPIGWLWEPETVCHAATELVQSKIRCTNRSAAKPAFTRSVPARHLAWFRCCRLCRWWRHFPEKELLIQGGKVSMKSTPQDAEWRAGEPMVNEAAYLWPFAKSVSPLAGDPDLSKPPVPASEIVPLTFCG